MNSPDAGAKQDQPDRAQQLTEPNEQPAAAQGTALRTADDTAQPSRDQPELGTPTCGELPDPASPQTCQLDAPTSGPGEGLPDFGVTVPGYQLLGLLGRGGMGVVYRARHLALERIVALKMISAGAHASEKERARFQREAQAVARLQHSNIVQLFEVGEADGHAFLSLEYVSGGSLDVKADGVPQPPGEAARLVQLLAQAMSYAHERGVIHRDLKPSNVLLEVSPAQPQGLGVPKISDFGLAKRLEDASGQTHSGAILGTPSYMSPEQADARSQEVGPLSDLYSLGAILYQLLTGIPLFRGPTILDTLEQVRTREPVPVRQLQPKVPRDLETICLKCLQKEPAKRYPNCTALADDLGRYLAGEPIRARPVSTAERLWRWCRRNPRLAVLSGTVAVLLVVIAVVSTVFAWQITLEKDRAVKARDLANYNASVAGEHVLLAEKKTEEAETARKLADRNAATANKNAAIAKDRHGAAVKHMINLVEKLERKLQGQRRGNKLEPAIRALRDDCLKILKDTLTGMSLEFEKTGVTSMSLVYAYQQFGDLLGRLHLNTEASRQYQLGCESLRRILKEKPRDDLARANLAFMLEKLADSTLEVTGDAEEARAHFLEAWRLQKDVADHPEGKRYTPTDNKRLLGNYDSKLGMMSLRLGDPVAAGKYFQELLQFRQDWVKDQPRLARPLSFLAQAHLLVAEASWRLGDNQAAKKHFDECLKKCLFLAERIPKDLSFRVDLADVHGARGDFALRQGATDEADQEYRAALADLELVAARDPDDSSRLPFLAQTHYRLGLAALRAGKRAEADKHFRDALAVRRDLAQEEPWSVTHQSALMIDLARCGLLAEAVKKAEELRPRAARSTELLLQLARCYAVCAGQTDVAPDQKKSRDQALAALKQASERGYRDGVTLRTDPDLEALRQEKEFRAIVDRLKR
jgi:serine/threonine-protein kinase